MSTSQRYPFPSRFSSSEKRDGVLSQATGTVRYDYCVTFPAGAPQYLARPPCLLTRSPFIRAQCVKGVTRRLKFSELVE